MTYKYQQVNHNQNRGSGIIKSEFFNEAVCGGLFIVGMGLILLLMVVLQ